MFLGDYIDVIALNVDVYTPLSILLVMYETIAIMITMFILMNSKSFDEYSCNDNNSFFPNKKYINVLFLLTILQIVIFIYTPELLEGYRSIFEIGDELFTNLEQAYIINKYATSFSTKFSLVLGSYLMNILRLLLPGFIIIWINRSKKNKLRLSLSYFIALTPFFMIDGAIARSIIYSFILFMVIRYLYPRKGTKQIAKILVVSSIIVIVYWLIRFNASNHSDIYKYFSLKFSAYFSGVNIVTGSFNLPRVERQPFFRQIHSEQE